MQANETLAGIRLLLGDRAGILGAARVLGREAPMPLEFFSKVIQVNLVGSFNVTKEAAAFMVNNEPTDDGERGVVISTASIACTPVMRLIGKACGARWNPQGSSGFKPPYGISCTASQKFHSGISYS